MVTVDDEMAGARATMVREVEANLSALSQFLPRGAASQRVLDALGTVPRHLFVPHADAAEAYANRPLPIGHRQTISQPLIVALMTDLLDVKPSDRVLEVGTGSGYQAAVLAQVANEVFSIETVPALSDRAQRAFEAVGLHTIHTRVGDGHLGWPEEAPFDGIVVTAAPTRIPEALIQQLKTGGRLVMPLGASRAQQLVVIEKPSDQSTTLREIIPVCFVPLVAAEDVFTDPSSTE